MRIIRSPKSPCHRTHGTQRMEMPMKAFTLMVLISASVNLAILGGDAMAAEAFDDYGRSIRLCDKLRPQNSQSRNSFALVWANCRYEATRSYWRANHIPDEDLLLPVRDKDRLSMTNMLYKRISPDEMNAQLFDHRSQLIAEMKRREHEEIEALADLFAETTLPRRYIPTPMYTQPSRGGSFYCSTTPNGVGGQHTNCQ
jgi:hypothetical protein